MTDKPLSELACGERGRVVSLHGEHRSSTRLMELGLLPGTVVEVVRFAPLRDPIELRLRGYALSIRRAEAKQIFVCDVDEEERS